MVTHSGARRGQSSIVGYALIVGFTLAMASSIVLIGATAVTDTRIAAQAGQAQQSMAQLSAQGSLVALGDAGPQHVRLSEEPQGSAAVEPNAGRIEVIWFDGTKEETLVNVKLGRVEYDLGETAFAYQAGGVWRRDEGGSTMVSPPKYHYRDRTLTFPIVRVTGPAWAGSPNRPLAVHKLGTTQKFPTSSDGNPLEDGHVHVRVTSDYHGGWAEFFETRTDGQVSHTPSTRTVSVNLTVPFTEEFDHAVVATSNGSDPIDRDSNFDSPKITGVKRPSASPKVDAEIANCEAGHCTDIDDDVSNEVLDNGTYYVDDDLDIEDVTYNTTDGDIEIVVDGGLTFSGSGGPPKCDRNGNNNPKDPNHIITGDGRVTFYVKGDMKMGGNPSVNTCGEPSQVVVLLHSNGDVAVTAGTPQFTGFIYAPNASLEVKGGGNPDIDNIHGGVVVRNATSKSSHGNLEYGGPGTLELEFEPIDTINWLHVTSNRVEVRPD